MEGGEKTMQVETVYAGPSESIAGAIERWYREHPNAAVQSVEMIDDRTARIQFVVER